MADTPPVPDTGADTGVGPDRESPPGMPGWVKAFGIVALAVALLVIGLMLLGGHEGGPGRHAPPAGITQAAEPSADLGGHAPPEGSR